MAKWYEGISVNKLYAIGIVSVACLIIVNQVISQQLRKERISDARVLNVSGKQRMLSQAIALDSFRANTQPEYLDSLRSKNQEFYHSHLDLLKGNEERGLPEIKNTSIKNELEALSPIVQQINTLISEVENLDELQRVRPQILEKTAAFLPLMDQVVDSIQDDSVRYLERLANIEMMIAFISILILLLEVKLVFKPILKTIHKKTKKLEHALLSRDRILATVVHDLRSPINSISGLNEILKTDLKEHITDDQEMMFGLVEDSAIKANHLIEELLEISILDSEEFKLETKSVRLEEYLISSISHFVNRAREKGVHLNVSLEERDLIVNIDPKRFARVIDNLISNALKFTDTDGEVSIELQDKGDEGVIVISDSGIGIPEKMQPYIFDKFSKARRQGLEGEQTTGLGMSIVKQIVELHNGDIWLKSEENKGTKFYIQLPKAS